MTMAQLAGVSQVRVTAQWRPGLTAPPDGELPRCGTRSTRAGSPGSASSSTSTRSASSVTPLTPQARAEFAAYTAAVVRAGYSRGDRRQRAEHQPLLDAAVRRGRLERGRGGVPAAARRDVRRRQGRATRARSSGASASRRAARTIPRSRATPTRRRASSATSAAVYRASGRDDADHGRSRDPPVRRQLEPGAECLRAPELDHDRGRRLSRSSSRAPRRGIRRDAAAGHDAADPLRRVRRRDADRERPRDASTRGRNQTTTRPVDAETQATYYREAIELAFCQPTVTGIFLFHLEDEKARAAWQSGLYDIEGRPRPAVATVRTAAQHVRRGIAARCNLQLTPRVGLAPAARSGRGRPPLLLEPRRELPRAPACARTAPSPARPRGASSAGRRRSSVCAARARARASSAGRSRPARSRTPRPQSP